MKKVLTILAVLALAAPAMAQDAITVSVVPTAGTLTISWDATGAASGGPVGFALAVNCSAGQIDSIDSVTSFFDIFIDKAYDMETATPGSYTYGAGTLADIAADPAGPGVVALPSSDFVLSFAGLGGASGTPVEPQLTGSIVLKTGATGATVDIALDTIRGGIVNKGGVMTVTGLPAEDIVVPGEGCTTCFGDLDHDNWVTVDELYALTANLVAALPVNGDYYYETTAAACDDMDGDGWVTVDEMYQLTANLVAAFAINGDYYYECGQL